MKVQWQVNDVKKHHVECSECPEYLDVTLKCHVLFNCVGLEFESEFGRHSSLVRLLYVPVIMA